MLHSLKSEVFLAFMIEPGFFCRPGPCALADHEISRRHELGRIISSA